jgi:TPR repeat protein
VWRQGNFIVALNNQNKVSPMQRIMGLRKWKPAQTFFVTIAISLATACSKNENAASPQTNAQSDAAAKWLAKRDASRKMKEAEPIPVPTATNKVDFSERLRAIVGTNLPSDKELKEKAERGDHAAQLELGRIAANNGDYDEAAKWYRKAADQGNVGGQHDLAVLYIYGTGVTQDYAEAVKLFSLAAAQGDVESQYSLGLRYLKGDHVTQNFNEAARFFGMAAEQGNADAQLSYGRRFAAGEGVAKDIVQAYKWYVLADKNGKYGASDVRDSLAKQMTPEEISQGINLANAFVPTKNK